MSKLQLLVLSGGQSAEHDISLMSARNVIDALDKNKYDVIEVLIKKTGEWMLKDQRVTVCLGGDQAALINVGIQEKILFDVVFPVLHGNNGEDGTIQGLCQLMQVPFVGPDTISTAICMDKDVSKRLLAQADLPVVEWLTVPIAELKNYSYEEIAKVLSDAFFVKPANTGSSIGVSKIKNEKDFKEAVALASRYDSKLLFERAIEGREIECAILGNKTLTASPLGEIIPKHEFYTYEAKYFDKEGAELVAPVELPKALEQKIQNIAKQAFKVLGCEGMSRVDFLVEGEKIYINELNTIPGFTEISMYPKLFQCAGIQYSELLDRLIDLALERHKKYESIASETQAITTG